MIRMVPLKMERFSVAEIGDYLHKLEEQGFLKSEFVPRLDEYTYHFDGDTVKRSILSLVPPSQQRSLHKRLCNVYLSAHADKLEAVAPQLAQHWYAAGEYEKSVKFYEVAARHAFGSDCLKKGIKFLHKAVHVAEQKREFRA